MFTRALQQVIIDKKQSLSYEQTVYTAEYLKIQQANWCRIDLRTDV